MSSARGSAAAVVAFAVLVAGAACGDGRPAFCDDLARNAGMTQLRRALDAGDLRAAQAATDRFVQLADAAPPDVRPDLRAVARGVDDVVALLRADRADAGTTDAELAARRREDLDRELADLARRSARVEAWASRTCGLDLRGG